MPNEQVPPNDVPYARGVWHGDPLPAFRFHDDQAFCGVALDLGPVRLGEGSWLERVIALRDAADLGPFRLAMLESLVRIADWIASGKEERGEYGDA